MAIAWPPANAVVHTRPTTTTKATYIMSIGSLRLLIAVLKYPPSFKQEEYLV